MIGPTLDSKPLPAPNPPASAPAKTPAEAPKTQHRPTRTGNIHAGLIIATVLLALLVVFLAQNAHTVTISFVGAQLHVSLAVALLAAALAGALILGAAGTARITQLRLNTRRAARDTTKRR
jgi:putative membrane protein